MATKKKAAASQKTKKKMPSDNKMKYHLIEKYRNVVAARYEYESIKNHPDAPANITPEIAETLKSYFLENLYPSPAKREKLDAAFTELENYVMHPSKIWNLLGNITAAIFRFGFQFPAAVKAGLISMEAYSSAKHFENTLTHAAIEKNFTIPVSDEQFYQCLVAIPKDDLYKFISELEQLFETFTNTDLLSKTIGIMEDVLDRMKQKPDMYGPNEVEAIELGIDIMQKGHDLFIQYDDDMKQEILRFISDNEKHFIEGLYKKSGVKK
jgi:hypothetical protein